MIKTDRRPRRDRSWHSTQTKQPWSVIRVTTVTSREAEGRRSRTRVVVALRRSGHGCIWRYVKSSSRRRFLFYFGIYFFLYSEKPTAISWHPRHDATWRTLRSATRRNTTLRCYDDTELSRERRQSALYVAISKRIFFVTRSFWLSRRRCRRYRHRQARSAYRVLCLVGTIVTYSILVRLFPLVSNYVLLFFESPSEMSAREGTPSSRQRKWESSRLEPTMTGFREIPRLKHRVCVRSQLMGPVSCLVRRVSLRLTPLPHFTSPLHFISPTPRFISLSFWLTSSLSRASRRINDPRFFFRRYQWLSLRFFQRAIWFWHVSLTISVMRDYFIYLYILLPKRERNCFVLKKSLWYFRTNRAE